MGSTSTAYTTDNLTFESYLSRKIGWSVDRLLCTFDDFIRDIYDRKFSMISTSNHSLNPCSSSTFAAPVGWFCLSCRAAGIFAGPLARSRLGCVERRVHPHSTQSACASGATFAVPVGWFCLSCRAASNFACPAARLCTFSFRCRGGCVERRVHPDSPQSACAPGGCGAAVSHRDASCSLSPATPCGSQ